MPSIRTRLLILLAVLIVGVGTVANLYLRFGRGSDGMRLEPGQPVWRPEGVLLTPLQSGTDPSRTLRPGDVVVGVEGASMETWAQALFAPLTPRPIWRVGQTVIYDVLRGGERVQVPVTLRPYPWGTILQEHSGAVLFVLASWLIAAFVLLRRPRELAAWLLFLWAGTGLHILSWSIGLEVADLVGGTGFWIFKLLTSVGWILYWTSVLHFALVFPTVHPLLARRPYASGLIYLLPFAAIAVYLAALRPLLSSSFLWLGRWNEAEYAIGLLYLGATVAISLWNYRHVRQPAARQRMRWLVLGVTVSGAAGILLWLGPLVLVGHPLITASGLGLVVLPFPAALALAILRNRLFDLDVIIRRTFIYGVLTAALALVYFISVVLLQQAFRLFTGEGGSQSVTVLSTLAAAVVFVPLRQRIQRAIDRRFYRSQYDAAKTLSDFATIARDEVNLQVLSERLVTAVQETVQPASLSLWLMPLPEGSPGEQPDGELGDTLAPAGEHGGPQHDFKIG